MPESGGHDSRPHAPLIRQRLPENPKETVLAYAKGEHWK